MFICSAQESPVGGKIIKIFVLLTGSIAVMAGALLDACGAAVPPGFCLHPPAEEARGEDYI